MDSSPSMQEVSFALDWALNTTHIALVVADALGAFSRRGIKLRLIPATAPGAPKTPADGLIDGSITFGLVPCDQLLCLHAAASSSSSSGAAGQVLAVATLLHADISALVVRRGSGIRGPRDLAGRTYASCGYPLEAATVNAAIAADGGSGSVVEVCPPGRVTTEAMLLSGEADCAWQYMTWEVLRATRAGVELDTFPLAQYNVPFGPMNCVCVAKSTAEARPDLVRSVLAAINEGAQGAAANPAQAADMLQRQAAGQGPDASEQQDRDFLEASIRQLVERGALLDGTGRWGLLDERGLDAFVAWVAPISVATGRVSGVASADLSLDGAWTNEFL